MDDAREILAAVSGGALKAALAAARDEIQVAITYVVQNGGGS